MKRTTLFCVALMAVLSGCAELEIEDQPQQRPSLGAESNLVQMTFAASTEVDGTRTAIAPDGSNNVYWYADDLISVFDVNPDPCKNASFEIDPSTYESSIVLPPPLPGGPSVESPNYPTEVSFTGLVPGSSTGYYAVYPFKDYSSYEDETPYGLYDRDADVVPETLHLEWLGQTQCAEEGSFDKQKGMMVAYTEQSTLNFKQVFAYFKFTTEFNCEEIVISGRNGEALAADDIFVQMQGEPGSQVPVVIDQKSDPSADGAVHLLPDPGCELIYPGTYLVAVLPQTLTNGFRISFHKPNAKEFSIDPFRETSKSVALSRARILNIGTFDSDFLAAATEWQGSGTQAAPYEIDNIVKLRILAERVNGSSHDTYAGKYYKLTADINCDGSVLLPIGSSESKAFTGHFDGCNHTISNYIPGCSNHSTGLFAYVKNAKIHNLNLRVKQIDKDYDGGYSHAYSPLVGTSVKSSDSDVTYITNCTVDEYGDSFTFSAGDISLYCGGLVGLAKSDFETRNCVNNCDFEVHSDIEAALNIYRFYSIGGILGATDEFSGEIHVKIHCCRNNGNLKTELIGDAYIGGIAGYLHDNHSIGGYDVIPIITDCVNRGALSINPSQAHYAADSYVGGIVGSMDTDGYHSEDPYVVNCLNAGPLYASSNPVYVGGILGFVYDNNTQVENCAVSYAALDANFYHPDDAHIGSMCGKDYGTYKYCHWTPYSYRESTIGITPTSSNANVSGCGQVTEVTSATMNANVGNITSLLGRTYCQWTGSGSTLDLDFSSGGPM